MMKDPLVMRNFAQCGRTDKEHVVPTCTCCKEDEIDKVAIHSSRGKKIEA